MQIPSIKGSALSINCYTENNTENNKQAKTYLQSCPGIKFKMSLGSDSKCDGLYVSSTGLKTNDYEPNLFYAYKGNIYKIDKTFNSYEVIGEYALGNTVVFAESGGERAVLLWVDGNAIYGYDLKTAEKVEITLPKRIDRNNSYIQPSHIAVVDGTIILNDLGSSYVYYSIKFPLNTKERKVFDIVDKKVQYEEDGITVKEKKVDSGKYCFLDDYGVQKYFNGSSSSDKTVALYSIGGLLAMYGTTSIEFWQKGSSESYQSWQRVNYSINQEQGIEAPYSLTSINNTQFCIGTGRASAKCVYAIEGYNVKKISPAWLDEILNTNEVKNVKGWSYSYKGHQFYLFNIKDTCYVYDLKTNEWHTRTSRNFYNSGLTKNYMPLYSVWWNNRIYTGSIENGNLYELDENYYYEDFDSEHSLPLLRVRQTPVITSNYKPFVIYELTIECNVGFANNYNTTSKLLLQISKDGGYEFGNIREANLGVKGNYTKRVRFLNLGMNRLCVIKLMYSEPTPFCITDSSIRYNELNTSV